MTDKKGKRTPLPFFCAFFQIAFTNFSHQGKVGKSLYKTKNVARRPQNFDCKKSYPTKITQIMAKFGCYVKHSSLQKGVFRHKIVKTLRKGSNHPPRCKQKTKRRLFCVAVPLGTCRQRNRGGGKSARRNQKHKIVPFGNNGKFLSFTITTTADTLPNVSVAP